MSDAARRALVEASEGRRLAAYRDCVGVWTIGYGHTSRAGPPAVTPGLRITQADADAILSRDLRTFEDGVWALVAQAKGGVAQREFDALVDLAFNVGLGAFRSSSLLRAYVAGDKRRAADKLLDWTRAGGRVLPGLVARRKRARAWFLAGDAQAAPAAQAAPVRNVRSPDPLAARAGNLVATTATQGVNAMKGYRTIIAGLGLAVAPSALQYVGAVDWQQIIGPTGAFFVSGLVAIGMRLMTSTPVGKPEGGK